MSDSTAAQFALPTLPAATAEDTVDAAATIAAASDVKCGNMRSSCLKSGDFKGMKSDPKPGEFILRTLFAEFAVLAQKKIDYVLSSEPLERPLAKSLQRGEDPVFDQLLTAFGSVAEHCLPSLLRTLFAWYDRQLEDRQLTASQSSQASDHKSVKSLTDSLSKATGKSLTNSESLEKAEHFYLMEKRDLAVEFIFCLFLIEVLKQLSLHPGYEELTNHIEALAFRHFRFREEAQNDPNLQNINMIADLYAEVIGVLAQSRFQSVRKRFMSEFKELRAKEPNNPITTHNIISLLMGMKFFRIKMVPIEEFEASFQFMHECAQYFLEVKDKDIKHALAGLFVEILVPVAATVKNEVNVPCLKNFVEMLYPPTLDLCTKKKHSLALFPLVTCLLCVSQKTFFLMNWHYFLAMCLQQLKIKEAKMSRVALESLYRLLWVYMIRIKCESNTATQSRLHSIVNSLFPKGSKAVMPRDTPLNIFVKIIQFIAQERLDFAMKEIVFDLLSVGRQIKIILTPERMSIGLRAFLVVADSLQQKDGEPPMPRTVGVLPSGNTLRVKKTFLNKMLTEEMARTIGMNHYYPYVRKTLSDILRALDVQFGRPLMMTTVQNMNKEPDDMITGERKPKIDLFRTCVAAVPRLIPDGMSKQDLVDLLARLTVHMDEEMKGLAFQSLQNMIVDFPDWREDVIEGFIHFLLHEINDSFPNLIDNSLRMLLQLLTSWKNALQNSTTSTSGGKDQTTSGAAESGSALTKNEHLVNVLHNVEALALVMLCYCRQPVRRIAAHILKEVKVLFKLLFAGKDYDEPVASVMDRMCPQIVELCFPFLPSGEKSAIISVSLNVDLHWLAERSGPAWVSGQNDNESESFNKTTDNSENQMDTESKMNAWSVCLMALVDEVIKSSPSAVSLSWPLICHRLNTLFTHLDPTPVSDNRATALLRGTTSTVKKSSTERDFYLELWKNYLMYACRIAPANVSNTATTMRYLPHETCASPDSLASEPSTIGNKSPMNRGVSAQSLFKQIMQLLRSEQNDLRNAVVLGLSHVNQFAFKELMEELVPYIREAFDRKQENLRRRKRRELLRIQIGRLLKLISDRNILSMSHCVIDRDAGTLSNTFIEYIDGARLYLETETDKDTTSLVPDIKQSFCSFIYRLIKGFSIENRSNLLSRELRRNLFYLFASWSGDYGNHVFINYKRNPQQPLQPITDLEYLSLSAMSAVLCCGSIFDPQCLFDESNLYLWLNHLLSCKQEKVADLALETIVLLLEYNTDVGSLLDWLVESCYTKETDVSDGCFKAIATIFSVREYPCDHYISIINVTLMNIGCPRAHIHQQALLLLQLLDNRFFGSKHDDMMIYNNNEQQQQQHTEHHNKIIDIEYDISDIQLRRPLKPTTTKYENTYEPLLANVYPCTQLDISRRMAHFHPQLSMPVFSEITYRFQTAKPTVCQNLLQYLIPWLYNIELVDPNVQPLQNPFTVYSESADMNIDNEFAKEGWGSVEASEMVLNNLFYITVKFGDNFPKEIEEIWTALCAYWPNNLRIIIRYLFILTGLANDLLPYAKRIVIYLSRAKPERLIDELMSELQTVESLNCLTERTEAPPFFRITSIRKGSGHSEDGVNESNGTSEGGHSTLLTFSESGTLHTKRHSAAEGISGDRYCCYDNCLNKQDNICCKHSDKMQTLNDEDFLLSDTLISRAINSGRYSQKPVTPQPRPLPMPEFGGYYAPLTEYLPTSGQPVVGFHRCNLALMFLTDLVSDGNAIDWTPHIPLMLHIIFLGLDHNRLLVHEHCKELLLNLLIVMTRHNDHLNVARILLNNTTQQLGYGLTISTSVPKPLPNFIDPPNLKNFNTNSNGSSRQSSLGRNKSRTVYSGGLLSSSSSAKEKKTIDDQTTNNNTNSNNNNNTNKDSETASEDITIADTKALYSVETLIKCLIDFISAKKGVPLWNYEDITAKVWSIRSSDQLAYFIEHILYVFKESLPLAKIEERWSEISLQLALSCSSRHYAGRSLQIFRALRMPINSRMLSDILSRLVETVSEQGEDMQGYVTELMLTLEAAVDSLDADPRLFGELVREFFKSTPNLNTKDNVNRRSLPVSTTSTSISSSSTIVSSSLPPYSSVPLTRHQIASHIRSTSYSVSYPNRKGIVTSDTLPPETTTTRETMRNRTNTDADYLRNSIQNNSSNNNSSLGRSRSAQSLKTLEEKQYMTIEDKTSLLAQFFWISVIMFETDYEHEFLLALRLFDKLLPKFGLEKIDSQEKVEKIFMQMKWNQFPGVHALLLKGCTSPITYEPTMNLLPKLTPLLEVNVIDPSESANSFPYHIMAQLPYLLLNYDEPTPLCTQAAENIALWCTEKSNKLDNLATVMMLYSRRSFSKENLQWTKCVVKYLYDAYSHAFLNLVSFLVEVAEKGPPVLLVHVLSILHCMLHYIDLNATTTINTDILKVITKYIEGLQWNNALKVLKLVVTRSSTLATPPVYNMSASYANINSGPQSGSYYSVDCISIASGASYAESEFSAKRELPGRTMDFTFDLTQTPIVGRKYLMKKNGPKSDSHVENVFDINSNGSNDREKVVNIDNNNIDKEVTASASSPRRSLSHNHSFNENNNWRRPWLSQSRIRERLIGLLTSCGQRVGLPKSPSVIFSQNSDVADCRKSSMASSTEDMSATNNDASGDSKLEDATHGEFALFKDFDFLEYELESQEGESLDNFNWGVRRRSLTNLETSERGDMKTNSPLHRNVGSISSLRKDDLSSDDEAESVSPIYDMTSDMTQSYLNNQLPLLESGHRPPSILSQSSSHSLCSEGDLTLSNTSASNSISPHVSHNPCLSNDIEEHWSTHFSHIMSDTTGSVCAQTYQLLARIFNETFKKVIHLTRESCELLPHSSEQFRGIISRFVNLLDIIGSQIEFPFVFVDSALFSVIPQLLDRHRLGVLEVQEHWETFNEKKDYLLDSLDSFKNHQKLEAIAAASANMTDTSTDLCKCLYKMHFQLMLLIESYLKLISLLKTNTSQCSMLLVSNLSQEVTAVKCELLKTITTAADDTESDRQSQCSASPQPSSSTTSTTSSNSTLDGNNSLTDYECHLKELVVSQQFAKAIKLLHRIRSQFPDYCCFGINDGISGGDDDDDDNIVNIVLTVYCNILCESRSYYLVITEPEHNPAEITRQLMDTSLQLSSTLHSLDLG
ncbi:protein furry-like isoform X2 [Oppia nitens]|uniref:protein furry-like isoform X2 n=1 Tax=Oppia nitens TaxID=1686743 RepID=UPI0023D9DA4E|nr:protein furry-like isoform X2 [Oppia nitens]